MSVCISRLWIGHEQAFEAFQFRQGGVELHPTTNNPIDQYPVSRSSALIGESRKRPFADAKVLRQRRRGSPETGRSARARADDFRPSIGHRRTLDEDLVICENPHRHAGSVDGTVWLVKKGD